MSVGGKRAVEVQLYLLLPLALWEGGRERKKGGKEAEERTEGGKGGRGRKGEHRWTDSS